MFSCGFNGIFGRKDLSDSLKFMPGAWELRIELSVRSHIYSYYLKTIGMQNKKEKRGGAEREKVWGDIRK